MSEQYAIRRAGAADIPTLVGFRERMLVELGADDLERLAELRRRAVDWFPGRLADGTAVGWVAEESGVPVGSVALTLSHTQPQYRSPSGRTALIYGLYVLPDRRGGGIATELVCEAVDHARAWGADIVTLHAADKARPLYERLGFVPTKEMRLQFSEQGGGSASCCG